MDSPFRQTRRHREEYYDAQQVCLRGHQITDSYNRHSGYRKNYCPECGEKTIHQCPKCRKEIRGEHYIEGTFCASSTPVPTFCEHCGEKFPWTLQEEDSSLSKSKPDFYNPSAVIQQICTRFHLVAKQLMKRYSGREPLTLEDEYDTQDLLHALLKIYFDDIRPEEWTPSYAGGCSRVDFLLKEEKIIIEVKKTRDGLKDKQVGEQLIIDIEKYKKHPDCKTLICFVYDPGGLLSNSKGLKNDLNREEDDLTVEVIITP